MASLLDFIFPKYSLRGREGEWMTASELQSLTSHSRFFSQEELKKRGVKSIDRLFAASTYRECPLLRRAIATFKYKKIPGLGEHLRDVLSDVVLGDMTLRRDSCFCPVPLHWMRQFSRGFNQAEVLARGLADATRLPLKQLLRRWRPTGAQTRRKRDDRWRAMKGAFCLRRGFGTDSDANLFPFCVYLVDDLFTTGATMEECARVLKEAGVKRVEGIVLAHG